MQILSNSHGCQSDDNCLTIWVAENLPTSKVVWPYNDDGRTMTNTVMRHMMIRITDLLLIKSDDPYR